MVRGLNIVLNYCAQLNGLSILIIGVSTPHILSNITAAFGLLNCCFGGLHVILCSITVLD